MASKAWKEAVEELQQKRDEICASKEKEPTVIKLAKETMKRLGYDRPIRIKIPRDAEHSITIDGDPIYDVSGAEVDINLLVKLLREAYLNVTIPEGEAEETAGEAEETAGDSEEAAREAKWVTIEVSIF